MKTLIATLIAVSALAAVVPAQAGFGPKDLPTQETMPGFGPKDLPTPETAPGFGPKDLPTPETAPGFSPRDFPEQPGPA